MWKGTSEEKQPAAPAPTWHTQGWLTYPQAAVVSPAIYSVKASSYHSALPPFQSYHQLSSSQEHSLTRSISERTVLLQSSFVPGAFWWSAEPRRHCWEIHRGKHPAEESQVSSGVPVGTQSSWSKTKDRSELPEHLEPGWARQLPRPAWDKSSKGHPADAVTLWAQLGRCVAHINIFAGARHTYGLSNKFFVK